LFESTPNRGGQGVGARLAIPGEVRERLGRPRKYYSVRKIERPNSDALDRYWQSSIDPDGHLRRPSEEREQRLQNCKPELAFINALEPGRVLDVGCGVGYALSALREGWEKHGTEISGFAARRAAEHGRIHLGTLESARYPAGHFDVIFFYHVIEHMDDPVAAVRECYRILRPGGHLLVGTPDFDSACARRFGENFRLLHDKTHTSLFSCDSLRCLLLDTGLVVEHVDFPFFDTEHFTHENLNKLFDTTQVSPPFYGNVMTFYCKKPRRSLALELLTLAARAAASAANDQARALERAHSLLVTRAAGGATLWLAGEDMAEHSRVFESAGYRTMVVEGTTELPPRCRAGDVLFVSDARDPACAILASSRRHQLSSVLFCDGAGKEHTADVVIEVDCADLRASRLAYGLLLKGLCVDCPAPREEAEP
jgi:SAM-dependent methyltransferase